MPTKTSNHQPENIISNAVIRYQAKRKLEGVTSITNTTSYVNRLYEPISKVHKNTTIPFAWITQFSSEYQTHLECISDYLLDKVSWWEETKTGVMFCDVDNCRNEENTLQLHHFRSSTLKNEMDMLQQCWDKCTTVYRSSIPAKSTKHFDENGTKINTRLTTLKYFNNDMVTSDSPLKSRSSDTSVTAHEITAQSNDSRTLNTFLLNHSAPTPTDIITTTATPIFCDSVNMRIFTNESSLSVSQLSTIPLDDSKSYKNLLTPVADKKKNINNSASTPVINNDMDIRTYYPTSSTPINATEDNTKDVIDQNNNIIDFKLKPRHPIEETFPETLSASSKMLLSLKIDNQVVETYDKLRKQMKQKNTSTTMTTKP